MLIAALLFLALIVANATSASAGSVIITQPVAKEVFEEQVIDLGLVGPGQKLEIEISRKAGDVDHRGSEYLWDQLAVNKESLPINWEKLDSLYYEKQMKAFVVVAKDTSDGEYDFTLTTSRDYGGVDPITFKAKVKVSKEVLKVVPVDNSITAGVNQPADFQFIVRNTGSASDIFEIRVNSGLPKAWVFRKTIFVPHNSEKILNYQIVTTDQGKFLVNFKIVSLSSDRIAVDTIGILEAKPSLIEDAKAASRGVILFPTIIQVVYNIVGFIAANFF